MRPDEAEGRFRSLLGEAGVALEGPFEPDTVRLAWEAFRRFAAVPVDGMSADNDSDMLLVQGGNFGMEAPAGMEQIECSFEFGDVPELISLSLTLWSSEATEGEFFERVEETPAFRAAAEV